MAAILGVVGAAVTAVVLTMASLVMRFIRQQNNAREYAANLERTNDVLRGDIARLRRERDQAWHDFDAAVHRAAEAEARLRGHEAHP